MAGHTQGGGVYMPMLQWRKPGGHVGDMCICGNKACECETCSRGRELYACTVCGVHGPRQQIVAHVASEHFALRVSIGSHQLHKHAHYRLGVSEHDEMRCVCGYSTVDQSQMDGHCLHLFDEKKTETFSQCPHKPKKAIKGGFCTHCVRRDQKNQWTCQLCGGAHIAEEQPSHHWQWHRIHDTAQTCKFCEASGVSKLEHRHFARPLSCDIPWCAVNKATGAQQRHDHDRTVVCQVPGCKNVCTLSPALSVSLCLRVGLYCYLSVCSCAGMCARTCLRACGRAGVRM